MTKTLWKYVLLLACLFGVSTAQAAFKDIKIDLTGHNLLTDQEVTDKTSVNFGVAIADDGTPSRVAADDASAAIILSGKYHSEEHGWGNFSATVAVEGPVRVSMGTCAWGSDVTVKDASGNTVATFNTNNGTCYHNNKAENIASAIYKGTEATTLTISGGSYTPYIAVEAVDPSEIVETATITYSLGDVVAEGSAPAEDKVDVGSKFTIPANRTLYVEGKTLTAWTDGTSQYAPGEEVTASETSITLTPIFADNTVSLADRTDAVTLIWDFQRKNGAPLLSCQGKTMIYITQAKVGDATIDVKMDCDATSGKIANGNWNDWCQMNGGTKLTIPSCKGAEVSLEAYGNITTTTIDGQTDYTQGTKISYTIANTAETIDIVIGDGSYYRYVQAVLPVVKGPQESVTFNNEAAKVIWPCNSSADYSAVGSVLPENAFSTVAMNTGDLTITGTGTGQAVDAEGKAVTFVKFKPAGTTQAVEWMVKPVKGVTFTPTKVSAYIQRFGTDSENGVTVTAQTEGGETVNLGNFTAPRANKTQAEDKYGSSSNYTNRFEIELTEAQQQQLATTDKLYVYATVGVGNTKEGGFSDIQIEGIVNGTSIPVAYYTLSASASPEEGAQVTVYPKADQYEDGSEVKLTATPAFGYDFVNWTDAAGNVLSEEEVYVHTVTDNTVITANTKKVNTYCLDITVEGGANDYMVSLNPAPTVVDGKNMYEEGTKVMLSAASNAILTFTNWSNGETASEMAVTMKEDKSLVASYSAIDFIAGWDFIKSGSNGRAADFAAADNDADALVLRNADGNESGWLDKSQQAAGGYEGRPAAVNWRQGASNGDVGNWYWQTSVNAAAFTDLKVITAMVYNYNAYTTQLVEYSLDGTTWTTIGKVVLEGAKNWADATFSVPAEANNQEKVYFRWISDKTSNVDGTASANDGITLGATFITGTAKLIDDGTAPKLVSSVPENNGTGASANGKVVLTFDEKIKLTDQAKATIDATELVPVVSGKTVICEYKGLNYSTDVKFVLAAGSVADLTDNVLNEEIVINFQTKVKPHVEKALYDFIVPVDGSITRALEAANSRGANATNRYRILITNGSYVFDTNGTTTGGDGNTYDDPRSYLTAPYVSFIGESMEGVTITNKTPAATWDNGYGQACPLEGIGKGDVLIIQKNGHDAYFQGLTMKSSMGDAHGRDIVLNDQSNRTIFKDARLWGYQDTYVSNSDAGKFYFEGGVIRGRTDYLCGKGDVYYNEVTLQQCGGGGYLAVPSKAKKYGYVFNNCYIKQETKDVTFYLGRPWGSGTPIACFINTKMDVNALGNGWADMSGGWPKRFAEFNSYLTTGTTIDLSGRRTSWTDGSGVEHKNDPILTIDEVKEMSLENVMGQDDDWDPTALTEQASAPTNVVIKGSTLSWDNNDYVLCWVLSKNGKFVCCTTENTYTVDDATAIWTVRAANEMGGLGESTQATISTGINEMKAEGNVLRTTLYNMSGMQVGNGYKGTVIQVQTLDNGQQVVTKTVR
ncbi:MAG: Ig-like domain-containing protein [Prevotella sp.]